MASIAGSLGMGTHYYRNGEVCDACADDHGTRYQTQQTYNPSSGNRVVYRNEERVVSRPVYSPTYISNRDDTYSSSNSFYSI